MKKLIMRVLLIVVLLPGLAIALDEPTFELEKVVGNIYLGKQNLPLYPFLSELPGSFLSVNMYVIASEDRDELVLIDVPGGAPFLPDTFPAVMAGIQNRFPEASIKAVLLTHDHIDHSWSIPHLLGSGVPIYASSVDMAAAPGPYDFPLAGFVTPIGPGFCLPFDEGVIKAVDLKGHTPGQLGYAYYPEDKTKKIKRLFIGDALLAPQDYGSNVDPLDITYYFRLDILVQDTYSFEDWITSLKAVRKQLKQKTKIFPSHGAVRDGYYWQKPKAYIKHTISVLKSFRPE